jgi:hypothetical protein
VLDDYRTAPLSELEKALFAFIDKLTCYSGPITCDDVDALKRLGWSEEAIYDAVTGGEADPLKSMREAGSQVEAARHATRVGWQHVGHVGLAAGALTAAQGTRLAGGAEDCPKKRGPETMPDHRDQPDHDGEQCERDEGVHGGSERNAVEKGRATDYRVQRKPTKRRAPSDAVIPPVATRGEHSPVTGDARGVPFNLSWQGL